MSYVYSIIVGDIILHLVVMGISTVDKVIKSIETEVLENMLNLSSTK